MTDANIQNIKSELQHKYYDYLHNMDTNETSVTGLLSVAPKI